MAQPQLTPEMLVARLGEYLVSRGHISAEDLQKALELSTGKNLERRILFFRSGFA